MQCGPKVQLLPKVPSLRPGRLTLPASVIRRQSRKILEISRAAATALGTAFLALATIVSTVVLAPACRRGGARLGALIGVPFLFLVAGCGQVHDTVSGAASDAASQAASAAADVARGRICSPLQDGQLSAQDRQLLSGLLPAAKAAGVPARFVTPLEEIASAGDQVPADSVTALLKACGLAPTPTPSST